MGCLEVDVLWSEGGVLEKQQRIVRSSVALLIVSLPRSNLYPNARWFRLFSAGSRWFDGWREVVGIVVLS